MPNYRPTLYHCTPSAHYPLTRGLLLLSVSELEAQASVRQLLSHNPAAARDLLAGRTTYRARTGEVIALADSQAADRARHIHDQLAQREEAEEMPTYGRRKSPRKEIKKMPAVEYKEHPPFTAEELSTARKEGRHFITDKEMEHARKSITSEERAVLARMRELQASSTEPTPVPPTVERAPQRSAGEQLAAMALDDGTGSREDTSSLSAGDQLVKLAALDPESDDDAVKKSIDKLFPSA